MAFSFYIEFILQWSIKNKIKRFNSKSWISNRWFFVASINLKLNNRREEKIETKKTGKFKSKKKNLQVIKQDYVDKI